VVVSVYAEPDDKRTEETYVTLLPGDAVQQPPPEPQVVTSAEVRAALLDDAIREFRSFMDRHSRVPEFEEVFREFERIEGAKG
jgi:hypothetical protein